MSLAIVTFIFIGLVVLGGFILNWWMDSYNEQLLEELKYRREIQAKKDAASVDKPAKA